METVIKIDSPHEFSDSTNMVLSNQRRLVPGRLGILVRQYNEIAGQTAFDIILAHTFKNRSDLMFLKLGSFQSKHYAPENFKM